MKHRIILATILLLLTSSARSNLFSIFDPVSIRAEAAANIAAQRAAEEAAKIQVESDRIAQERGEALVALIKLAAYLGYNTLKFMKEFCVSTKAVQRNLKRGKPEVVTGCLGTVVLILGGIIWYNSRPERRANNEYRPQQHPGDLPPPAYDEQPGEPSAPEYSQLRK